MRPIQEALKVRFLKNTSSFKSIFRASCYNVRLEMRTMYDTEKSAGSTSGESMTEEELILAQIAQEKGREVKYRTCSWQKVWDPQLFSVFFLTNSFRPLLSCSQNISVSQSCRFPGHSNRIIIQIMIWLNSTLGRSQSSGWSLGLLSHSRWPQCASTRQ